MAADTPREDWQREAARFRSSPLDALGEAVVLGEPELREHLYLLGVPLPAIDRAVARAKGWRDLTPLEQAILDLPLHEGPTGDQIWHALPEALRPTVGEHEGFTMLELELVLRGIERRGMLVRASSGPQPSQELNDAINGWGTVPETLRREVYERIIAGAIENGGAEPPHELSRALFAILPQGLAGAAGPEHIALPDPERVPMPARMPGERWPACARCSTRVEAMRRFDNIKTGDMRIELTCHGETREVLFTGAELVATGKISTMIHDRLARAWEPSA